MTIDHGTRFSVRHRLSWVALILTGCAGAAGPISSEDASVIDAGQDAGVDAGWSDAGPADAGWVDAGAGDAGPGDAGAADAGRSDAGSPTDAGHGSSDAGPGVLTLTGFTGAGTRAVAAPVWFQNFTTTSSGQTALELGYQRGAGYPVAVDMTDGLDSRSGCLAWLTGPGADVGGGIAEIFPHVYNDLPAGSTKVFRSVSLKIVKTKSTSGLTGAMQFKSIRAGTMSPTDNTPAYSGQPAFKTSLYINAGAGDFNSVYSTWEGVGDVEATHTEWSTATPPWTTGGWNTLKVIFVHNTPGASDGRLEYWVNGTRILNRSGTGERTLASQYFQYAQLLPGFDFKVGDEWTVKFANDYLDNDLARVELTDSATYATSTRWAMQPVSAWSDSSITVKLNTVGFAPGTRGYFHVFDGAGQYVAVVARDL